ncbi:hypothetical protein E2C01_030003 [Portunus trituberculatus]|uniref:Uncharacterized protein n=1 Tax=Portunus trituberculatus TaxID=210409 RepID=A0A5B7EQW6_PORTR|nr:hypothetical protein [Portunus trituberculatus]
MEVREGGGKKERLPATTRGVTDRLRGDGGPHLPWVWRRGGSGREDRADRRCYTNQTNQTSSFSKRLKYDTAHDARPASSQGRGDNKPMEKLPSNAKTERGKAEMRA